MKNSTWVWPAVIILSAVGAGVTTLLNVVSPVRPLIVFWFLLVCPGIAWVRLLHIVDALTELTLAIAFSLVIDALVAVAMLYAGLWSPQWSLITLICIGVVGASIQLWSGLKQAGFHSEQTIMNQEGKFS